jgi:cysteinyl-tRNA synthetase
MSNTLQIYNTLTGKKEAFVPINGNSVTIYSCGPTVYDLSHLGHARKEITWDVIQRYLRYRGFQVTFVRNITDVDDKIIKRAHERGVRPEQVAREYTFEFWRDMHSLNVSQPDFEPRCTEYIHPMIQFIEELIAKELAYQSGSDVYFDVHKFKEYGKLSKQNVDQLIVGSREQARSQEELAERKRSPVDFALWKGAPEGELSWSSPWGFGRPGWHLECSTMIRHVLGETIDIHGGGEDLVFPHHENEIAQSESLLGKPLARFWMHNAFLQVNSEKMSKSLGNFSTIQDLLKSFSADCIRLLILQTHYRSPIDFTHDSLIAANKGVQRLVRAVTFAGGASANGDRDTAGGAPFEIVNKVQAEFAEAMDNDFNTAIAITTLFTLADRVFSSKDEKEKVACAMALRKYSDVLGLKLVDNRQELDAPTVGKVMDLVLDLRKSAREKKDYATSDLIRSKLTECGISVMDTAEGAAWERS